MKVKNTLIRQVYDELKSDSRKGDFFSLVQKDMKDISIYTDETRIEEYPKSIWKKIVKKAVMESAFQYLTSENLLLKNTKDIIFL